MATLYGNDCYWRTMVKQMLHKYSSLQELCSEVIPKLDDDVFDPAENELISLWYQEKGCTFTQEDYEYAVVCGYGDSWYCVEYQEKQNGTYFYSELKVATRKNSSIPKETTSQKNIKYSASKTPHIININGIRVVTTDRKLSDGLVRKRPQRFVAAGVSEVITGITRVGVRYTFSLIKKVRAMNSQQRRCIKFDYSSDIFPSWQQAT